MMIVRILFKSLLIILILQSQLLAQESLRTQFRLWTSANNPNKKINAAPLKLKTYGEWNRSWLELWFRNKKTGRYHINSFSEQDSEWLKGWSERILPGETTGVRLRAKSATRSVRKYTTYSSTFETFNRVRTSEGSLDLTVTNLRRATKDIIVEWYFFGSPAGNGQSKTYSILGGARIDLALHPLEDTNLRTFAAAAASKKTTYAALQERYIFGGNYYGWVAIAYTDDFPVAVQASLNHLASLYDPATRTWSSRVNNEDYTPIRVLMGGRENAVFHCSTAKHTDDVLRLDAGEIIIFSEPPPKPITPGTNAVLFKKGLSDWSIYIEDHGIFECDLWNNLVFGQEYNHTEYTVTALSKDGKEVTLDGLAKFRVGLGKLDFRNWEIDSEVLLYATDTSTFMLNTSAEENINVVRILD
tara:strand:+ start:213 stop:1457 length:1245 start_codon:yes stop_codon:yes gene_type:complete